MKKKNPKIKYIVLLVLILAVGLFGVGMILLAGPDGGLPMDNAFIPSESVLILGILALLLPVFLLALTVSIAKKYKKPKRIQAMPEAKLSARLDGKKDAPKKG